MPCFIRFLPLIVNEMYKLASTPNKRVMVLLAWYLEKNPKPHICFLYNNFSVRYLLFCCILIFGPSPIFIRASKSIHILKSGYIFRLSLAIFNHLIAFLQPCIQSNLVEWIFFSLASGIILFILLTYSPLG